MKRVATAVVLLAALVLGTAALAAVSRGRDLDQAGCAGPRSTRRRSPSGSAGAPRELNEFKKVVAEYDRKTPERHGQGRRRRSTTTRSSQRSARGNAPDVVSSFTSANVGIYCPSGGWIDLAPVPEARQHQHEHLPGGDALLHPVQGQALRAAAPRRRLRLLLQQDALQAGRPEAAAEDAVAARRVREEADEEERGRLARRSSATTPSSASTRTRRRLPAARRREVLRRERASRASARTRRGRSSSAGRRA